LLERRLDRFHVTEVALGSGYLVTGARRGLTCPVGSLVPGHLTDPGGSALHDAPELLVDGLLERMRLPATVCAQPRPGTRPSCTAGSALSGCSSGQGC
jgi:hypothetical protein